MQTFPMFLKMRDRHVVILGGGEQAAQKCRLMLKTEARIVVMAPALEEELSALAGQGRIDWQTGAVTPEALSGAALCFVATGCPGLDAAVHTLAAEARVVTNVVDQPDLCDAITPSIVDRDPVVVAIGTEGTAPVLARQIKTRVEEMLEPRLGDLAALAGRLRARAAARLGPRARRDLWRWVFAGPVRTQFARGGERAAAQALKEAIETGAFGAAAPTPVALVGAGPGSRDLITLRGVQRLQEADIIFFDRLIDPGLLELARRDAERVFVGKAPGAHAMRQDQINGALVSAARQGKRVVRLKCGDPGIFARGAEEADALRDAGFEVEIVPGVTAASAAAAVSGDFLTRRGRNDTLVLTTGKTEDGGDPPDWLAHLQCGAHVAIYMGVGAAGRIVGALSASGVLSLTEARIVSGAETPAQQVVICPAAQMEAAISDHALANPAIIFLHCQPGASAAGLRLAAG